ncbi:MAG TPA: hypothetical protein GX707_19025 [Epulopiscium sp.]|nr:hypothetical protein [Candidatus Epulonipiscium sp.]
MGKRELRSITLIILITLSIWQTSKLWLGNTPGLSFFAFSKESGRDQMEPESIWIVPGAPGTLVYRLGEENREYQSVRGEIEKNISAYLQEPKVREVRTLDWQELFQNRGILYQYPMPITYGEMIGMGAGATPKNKIDINNIDYVFIQLTDDNRGIAKWQLVSSVNNKSVTIEVQGQFDNMKAFNDLLTEEALTYKVKYQPSFNMGGISNKNLFLPVASKDTPIPYDILEWHNPLEQEEDLSKFNPYVNHYFLNPLLKKEEITNDGVYIFSELMKAVVKYYPSGIFEYSNISVMENKTKIPRLEAYHIGRRFLEENDSITKEIRNSLFLSGIEEIDTGYIFSFDMRIGGIPIYFSEVERERLGMDNMVKIVVEGHEVSNFKWNASELRDKTTGYTTDPKTNYFSMKYTDAINKVLEYVSINKEFNTLVIDNMKWVYMVNGPEEEISIRWIILHEDEWYSP